MAKNNAAPVLKKFSAIKQRRLDFLLGKNSEGTISSKERILLAALIREAEQLMVTNAKRLVEVARHGENSVPANAVPVTVWVTPSPTVK
jgi:hypothetical protein